MPEIRRFTHIFQQIIGSPAAMNFQLLKSHTETASTGINTVCVYRVYSVKKFSKNIEIPM